MRLRLRSWRAGPPLEVVESVLDNDLLTAGDVYGMPEAGERVQIDHLQIEHRQGTTEITVYNRAIMLFSTDDDIYPRVHRVCGAIEKQTERS